MKPKRLRDELVSYVAGPYALPVLELDMRRARLVASRTPSDTWELSVCVGRRRSALWRVCGRASSEAAAVAYLVDGPHDLFAPPASTRSAGACRLDGCGRDAAGAHGFCEKHLGRVAGAFLRLWERASSQEELEGLWLKIADELAFQEGGIT